VSTEFDFYSIVKSCLLIKLEMQLQTLCLSGNKLGIEGAQGIQLLLTNNTSITNLELYSVGIILLI
jgi:hypothetical protein